MVAAQKVYTLGVADLEVQQLKALYEAAAEVRPMIDHYNIENCCTVSQAHGLQSTLTMDKNDKSPSLKFVQNVSAMFIMLISVWDGQKNKSDEDFPSAPFFFDWAFANCRSSKRLYFQVSFIFLSFVHLSFRI